MSEAVSLSFHWKPIGPLQIDQAGKLVFRQAPSAPGVYRLEIDGDKALISFGEAADLRQRFRQQRNPGRTQQTNLRMEDLLCEILRAGGPQGAARSDSGDDGLPQPGRRPASRGAPSPRSC